MPSSLKSLFGHSKKNVGSGDVSRSHTIKFARPRQSTQFCNYSITSQSGKYGKTDEQSPKSRPWEGTTGELKGV